MVFEDYCQVKRRIIHGIARKIPLRFLQITERDIEYKILVVSDSWRTSNLLDEYRAV
jgi:hypothetical protein